MDIAYQQKWSITYDFQLMLKTLRVVAQKDGAY
jgi:lipopolysaccharide/colanic/teichoic acid biosynthesis glycosyltransferase